MSRKPALRLRTEQALREAAEMLPQSGPAGEIRARLATASADLDRKLQVAVVGRVKTGKSTLVNALLGERLAPTGVLELTFNINHLRHGPKRSVTARFDGSEIVLDSLEALEQHDAIKQYTARTDDNREALRRVKLVEVVCDNPRLEFFDLIDTPGLDSVFGEESAKTLAKMGLAGDEVRCASARAAKRADALIVVLDNRLASAMDEKVLAEFRGPGLRGRTPVTTLGVMTKVENLWEYDGPEPMALAERNVGRLVRAGVMHELLFEIVPVCSLIGEAAATLDEADFCDLQQLKEVGAEQLADALAEGSIFAESDELPLDTSRRVELHRRFSPYGIHVACTEIRRGADTVDKLKARLDEVSGMQRLRKRIVDHFGHRADLLKISELAGRVDELPRRHRASLDPRDRTRLTTR